MSIATRKQAMMNEADFRLKLADLARKAKSYDAQLLERTQRGETITARDMAIAVENNQKFLDLLNEMQDAGYIEE